jgi:hypothetical protein
MKAKKTLFLTVFTLMLLVGLVATGAALAAPAGLDVHQPMPVAGAISPPVSEVNGEPYVDWTDPANPMFVRPGNAIMYEFYGDLEGIFVESVTFRAPLLTFDGHYTVEGQATFAGTLNGKKASWTGSIAGSGFIDPVYGGAAGWESCVTTITNSASPPSHMRGTIASTGTWDPTGGSASYSGLLTWDTGEKN